MAEAYIAGGVRTGIGAYGGSLAPVRADDLAAFVIKSLLARFPSVPPEQITDLLFGCANQAGEDNRNVARMAALLSGLPFSVPGQTINRLCASGLEAVIHASRAARLEDGLIFIAGGVEQMSRAPWVMAKPGAAYARNPEIFDTTLGWRFINQRMKDLYGTHSMGETAEEVATQWKIGRAEQDAFAEWSQRKAAKAQSSGRLAREIVEIQVSAGKGTTTGFATDEFVRSDTTQEKLSKLKPAFRSDGSVTAGNSSGINDGAAALLICSDDGAKRFGISPLARIVGSAVAGVEPRTMGIGPVPAIRALLDRTKVKLSDIAILELNEAFAAQTVACLKELGISPSDPRVNPNGGAIALGHPLGMSGARLALTAALELADRKERYALCSMCVGVGQGVAVLLERVK